MLFEIDQLVKLKSGEIMGVTNSHDGVIFATNRLTEPKDMDDGERLYSVKFQNKSGGYKLIELRGKHLEPIPIKQGKKGRKK